jgi:hypothetical protein
MQKVLHLTEPRTLVQNLKTAVTTKPSKLKAGSKDAKRRASFCARMTGMRKRQKASNNTGEDRLSKSLRKWNC